MNQRTVLRNVFLAMSLVGTTVAMTVDQSATVVTQSVDYSYDEAVAALVKTNSAHAEKLAKTTPYYRELYFLSMDDRDLLIKYIPVDDYCWGKEIALLAQTNLRHAQILSQTDLYYRALYFDGPSDRRESLMSIIPMYENFIGVVSDMVPQHHVETDNKEIERDAKSSLPSAQLIMLTDIYRYVNQKIAERDAKEASLALPCGASSVTGTVEAASSSAANVTGSMSSMGSSNGRCS
jgi:hypothetical protein